MNSASRSIKVITLNVRGLLNANKRRKVFAWIKKQKCDITLLQETHCVKSKQDKFSRDWEGKSSYAVTPSPYSRGVGILFNPKLNVIVQSSHSLDGRSLLMNVEIDNKPLTIANFYAPNDQNSRSDFFLEHE